MDFFNELATRNYALYVFGLVCFAGAVVTAVLTQTTSTQVLGINSFIKPFKFFLSTVIFTWTMTWYLDYLNDSVTIKAYTWTVIITLTLELVYITGKAAIGQLSHFNVSTPQNAMMFNLMGVAIVMFKGIVNKMEHAGRFWCGTCEDPGHGRPGLPGHRRASPRPAGWWTRGD